MGVLVSPTARRTVPKMMVAVRGSMGRYKMKKYCPASRRSGSSTRIQTGITPDRPRVRTVKKPPQTAVTSTACMTALEAAFLSFAP